MITTFLDIEERLASLSQSGDPLEALTTAVDFEVFRSVLERAVPRAETHIGLANLAYNMHRLVYWEKKTAPA